MLLLGACEAPEYPPIVIPWAWHRAEDLSFLEPMTPVAVWFATIDVRADGIRTTRRSQRVIFHADAPLIAVFRIESDEPFTPRTIDTLTGIIDDVADRVGADEIQLDFDATRSQRLSYQGLITSINARSTQPLSITALASWCIHDEWLSSVNVDDVVAMLYRMGRDDESVRATIHRRTRADSPPLLEHCSTSVGYISDEPIIRVDPPARVFVFHTEAWTAERFADFRRKVHDSLRP